MTIGIVDYAAGNLTSVEQALAHLGYPFLTSGKPEVLMGCDKLIIPGDGHAGSAMESLAAEGLDSFLKEWHQAGRWLLGICIGCQIILDRSDEGPTECLGLLPGACHRLPGGPGLKVPHMGWNTVRPQGDNYLFKGLPSDASYYFVHSYFTQPERRDDVWGVAEHGLAFPAAIGRDNLAAVQFHPEKSGPTGLRLLENFLKAE